jgi:hypothetical protein
VDLLSCALWPISEFLKNFPDACLDEQINVRKYIAARDSGVENKIDALVCAWVEIKVKEGCAMAIGDHEASIWLPADPPPSARAKDWSAYLGSDAVASEDFMEEVEDLAVQERPALSDPSRQGGHLRRR